MAIENNPEHANILNDHYYQTERYGDVTVLAF
jgi:hypothetical protein